MSGPSDYACAGSTSGSADKLGSPCAPSSRLEHSGELGLLIDPQRVTPRAGRADLPAFVVRPTAAQDTGIPHRHSGVSRLTARHREWDRGRMTNDLTQIYVGQPDIPVGITVSEYRRSRPRRPWVARSAAHVALSAASPAQSRHHWNVRVLLVEDDVRMAAAIRRGLRFEGLVVDIAPDGEAALRTVGAIDYDAIVLDVMMPGLDGFETCRMRLRASTASGCRC